MSSEMSDLSVLIPDPVVVMVKDESITVRQMKMKQLPKIMKVVAPYYGKLKESQEKAKKDKGELDLLGIVMEYFDPVADTVAILVEKDREWVDDLDIDEMVRLLEVVIEVNVDFFIQKVLPSLPRLVKELGGVMKVPNLTGQTPSNS
jgi:hypothetical protein